MATDIGKLVARLEADASRFNKELRLASRELKSTETRVQRTSRTFRRSMDRMFTGASRVAKQVFSMRGAMVAAGAATGMGLLVKRSVETADALQKQADLLGVNVEALQELRFAAERSGVAQQTFDMALQRFTRRAAEASQGTGEAQDAIRQLGIQLTDSAGRMRPTEDLLGDVADAMSQIEDPSRRVQLAFKLFDSEGVRMLNMLRDGREGMEDVRREARDLGVVLSEETTREAVRTQDAFTNLSRVFSVNFTRAVLGVQEDARGLAETLSDPDTIEGVRDLAQATGTLADMLKELGTAAGRHGSAIVAIYDLFKERPDAARSTFSLRAEADFLETMLEGMGPLGESDIGLLPERRARIEEIRRILADREARRFTTESARRAQFESLGLPFPEPRPAAPSTGLGAGGGDAGGAPTPAGPSHLDQALRFQREVDQEMRRLAEDRRRLEEEITRDSLVAQGKRVELIRREMDERREAVERQFATEKETRERLLSEIDTIEQERLAQLQSETAVVGRAWETMFSGMADAAADFALGADVSFENVFRSFARMLIRMELEAAASSVFGGGGGGGAGQSLTGQLLGAAVSTVVGGIGGLFAGGATAAATSGVALADGGVVTSPTRALIGESGPEAVIPLDQLDQLGGADPPPVQINVQNESPSVRVSAEQAQGPDGRTMVRLMVQDALASDVARNGPITRQLASTFGLARGGSRR